MRLKFTKMQALGNDFVLLDALARQFGLALRHVDALPAALAA